MAQTARPVSSKAGPGGTGAWNATPSVADSIQYQHIDDDPADDATFLSRGSGSQFASCGEFGDLTDPSVSTGHIIQCRHKGTSGTGSASFRLYQGDPTGTGTQIKAVSLSETGALDDESFTLSGAEADAITNYADLWWALVAGTGTYTQEVYEIYLIVPSVGGSQFISIIAGV